MICFVMGASGFVGSNLVHELAARGHEVRALLRPGSDVRGLAGARYLAVEGDVSDRARLAAAMKGCDWCFHVAASYHLWMPDYAPMYAANVEGTRHVIEAGRVWSLVNVTLPQAPRTKAGRQQRIEGFKFALRKDKLREVMKREGRYLLRTNLKETDPAKVWEFYLQLVNVEEAFKNLKGDLSLRPIFHQLEGRIEAHIFVGFLAYCVQVTLQHQLRAKAPGLTVRQVLEKMGRIQLMDVHFPTTDGRELVFVRYTQPEKDQQLLLTQMKWELPPQAPPKITAKGELENGYRPLPSAA